MKVRHDAPESSQYAKSSASKRGMSNLSSMRVVVSMAPSPFTKANRSFMFVRVRSLYPAGSNLHIPLIMQRDITSELLRLFTLHSEIKTLGDQSSRSRCELVAIVPSRGII